MRNGEKNLPPDTAKLARGNPEGVLGGAYLAGSTEFIRRQQEQGQLAVVQCDALPRKMSPEAKEALTAAGVKFAPTVVGCADEPYDDLFQQVELPPGWKKVPTDDRRFTRLVDEHGQERACIFYKPEFYDRKAELYLRGQPKKRGRPKIQ